MESSSTIGMNYFRGAESTEVLKHARGCFKRCGGLRRKKFYPSRKGTNQDKNVFIPMVVLLERPNENDFGWVV